MHLRKGVGAVVGLSLLTGAAVFPAVTAAQEPTRIEVVSHGQASDPFWSVVKNGVDAAAADTGATVNYSAPGTFDMVAMSQLIDTAVATSPNGLVVSLPDVDALGPSIQAAVDAGIPVISMNSGAGDSDGDGIPDFKEVGILVHVGQTEYEAGVGGGERMAAAGVTTAICVNQEVGNTALDQRCQGFTDALTAAGGTVEVVAVDLADPTGAQATITGTIENKPDINGVLTLGPTGASPALAALTEMGKLDGSIKLATFDLSPDVLTAIDAGQMLFAIDQQQYLQGYLPVLFLDQYTKYGGLLPGGGGIILTGPGFVTQENAAAVIELSQQGIR
jgi:simple sugar transport system substrate-binding protein